MKILIVKLGAIGDIIHTLPVLAAIRAEMPDAEVSWVAESRSAEILRENPLIHNLIEVDTRSLRSGRTFDKLLSDLSKQVKDLRRLSFDTAIDLQGLLKSGMISKLSGARKRWGFSRAGLREPAARVFYTNTVDVPPGNHVIHRNLTLAGTALGLRNIVAPPAFPISTGLEHKAEAASIIARAGSDFAVLNPAGGWVTKLWPAENYGRLADLIWDKFRISSVIVTGPAESELAARAVAASRAGKVIATEPSLKGFFELAAQARIYVGGDTGPTHLAIASGAPVVGIFGPTEWWRNGSLRVDDVCVERTDIGCRKECRRRTCSNWICMEIAPESVLDAVGRRLEAAAAVRSEEVAGPGV